MQGLVWALERRVREGGLSADLTLADPNPNPKVFDVCVCEEKACRCWACFARRGWFWECFSPATDDENCRATQRSCTL